MSLVDPYCPSDHTTCTLFLESVAIAGFKLSRASSDRSMTVEYAADNKLGRGDPYDCPACCLWSALFFTTFPAAIRVPKINIKVQIKNPFLNLELVTKKCTPLGDYFECLSVCSLYLSFPRKGGGAWLAAVHSKAIYSHVWWVTSNDHFTLG